MGLFSLFKKTSDSTIDKEVDVQPILPQHDFAHEEQNSIDFDVFVNNVVCPQYAALESRQDKELAAFLIREFVKNPISSYEADNMCVSLAKHFFENMSNIIDMRCMGSNNYLTFVNDLINSLNQQSGLNISTHDVLKNINDLKNKHLSQLKSLLAEHVNIEKDATYNDIDYYLLLTDEKYRQEIDNKISAKLKEFNTKFFSLYNAHLPFEEAYKKAQSTMMIRQRGIVSLVIVMLFIQVLGNHYISALKANHKEEIEEWYSIAYPDVYKSIQEPLNEAWYESASKQIDTFINQLSLAYQNFELYAKSMFLNYQSDILVCKNLAKILYSLYMDKRQISMLIQTKMNWNYIGLTNCLLEANKIKQFDVSFSENNSGEFEQRISAIENYIQDLTNKLNQVKSMKSNQNWQDMAKSEAIVDLQKQTFKSHEEFEYYALSGDGKQEFILLSNNNWFKNYNLADLVKNSSVHSVPMGNFIRHFNALPMELIYEIVEDFASNSNLYPCKFIDSDNYLNHFINENEHNIQRYFFIDEKDGVFFISVYNGYSSNENVLEKHNINTKQIRLQPFNLDLVNFD